MWWPRAFLAAFLCAAVAGCGFTPLYGPRAGAPTAAKLRDVRVAVIADREGQLLRNALEANFLRGDLSGNPRYELTVALEETREELDLREDGTATRATLIVRARYQLVALDTRQPVLNGQSRSLAGYDILSSPYATLIGQRDARQRAVEQIALDVQTRVAAYLDNPDNP